MKKVAPVETTDSKGERGSGMLSYKAVPFKIVELTIQ